MQKAHRKLGKIEPPFIIAEMSGNHSHSLKRALQIVESSALSGASALKNSNIYGGYDDT